tara:strand:+ start:4547 stop:5596 length:1050 start_codon:yes stop_codon:yes gene_type:complete
MLSCLTWIGIVFCLTQSAIFSGLNLAFFSISRLRLEIEVANGNSAATKILELRKDSNFLLTTILWGNVSINVLLTLLANSVMFGLIAFLFSTVVITIGGEILPQAYFSRNALRMASLLTPMLRVYQILLFVIAKPCALFLDIWLGKEGVQYFREQDLRQLLHKHIDAADSDVDAVEGIGALNFLAIDDVPVSQEGEVISQASLFSVQMENNQALFYTDDANPAAGQKKLTEHISVSPHRWIVLIDIDARPTFALDGDAFLRAIHGSSGSIVDPTPYCHKPVVVTDPKTRLGAVLSLFKGGSEAQSDEPLREDVILLWGDEKRIITGADILGRLLKGIGLYSSIRQPKRG